MLTAYSTLFISCYSQQREQIIFDHFSDPVFINQFIEFLSLEDRKGKDKFSPRRFCLFKVKLSPTVASDSGDDVQLNWITETNYPAPEPPGIVPQLQRCLSASAAAPYGTPSGRLPWEQAALCCRDHFWTDQRLQALELLTGMDLRRGGYFHVLSVNLLELF